MMVKTLLRKSVKLTLLEARIAIVANILLFGLKLWAGTVVGSIALIADAWHTLSDSVSSIVVLFGVKVAQKPADHEHPYGHGRAELIATLAIGVMLVVVAWSFLRESWLRLQGGESVVFGALAITVTAISVVVKEGLAQFAFRANKKVTSNILRADAWHHRSDAISSAALLVGMFLSFCFWWMDGVLGFLVALMIGYAAFEIIRDSIHQFLGRAVNPATREKIRDICKEYGVKSESIHHFHKHEYGDHMELTFHLRLPNNMTVETAHEIVKDIEQRIRDELDMETTVHVEPLVR
ncbi:MAG: cation diffusion facilitator family transporter [candidate division KSB1 bacterium]|nr:cation diffusion facilitator family transporter [candidate division KSB1 bacterium]